jgi:hypothetical protein
VTRVRLAVTTVGLAVRMVTLVVTVVTVAVTILAARLQPQERKQQTTSYLIGETKESSVPL